MKRFKIEYMEGEGGLEVVDLRNSTVAATLNAAGDVFEQNMQGNAEFLVCDAGRSGIREDVPGKASHDDIQRTGSRSGFPSGAHSQPERGTLGDPLPPGAGEPGSNVADVRVPESETEPSQSSDSTPSDRQAEYDAARTRSSPRGTI